jgi:cation diffusion facilitator family transporter
MAIDTSDPGAGAYALTILVNAGLAAAKLGMGFLAGSPALIADGWHSLSDVAMNLLAWAGYRFSKAPADEDHHYGHGNWEAVAGLVVGLIVIGAGAGIAWGVLLGGAEATDPEHGPLALGVGVGSGLAKLLLARYTAEVGARLNSPSLIAVSRDNMTDALTGTLVPIAIGLSLAGVLWAEQICALLIAGVVFWMGARSAKEGLDILMDRVDPRVRGRVEATASDVAGVRGIQSIRVHPLGSELRIDMEISVDGTLTVEQGHRIAHAVERAVVGAHEHVSEVNVHVNPVQVLSEPSP